MASTTATRVLAVVRNKHHNAAKSYIKAMKKWKFTPTQPSHYFRDNEHVLYKKQADGTQGVVTAQDYEQDSFYACPVQIGTPAQTVNLDFDSGSSDLWVCSTELDQATQAQIQSNKVAIFDASKSTTFKPISDAIWKISYGDGSNASGDVGTDNVTIGDITIKGQAVELAKQLSDQFAFGESSGLLGLAFGSINTVTPTPVKTPVENMIAQNDIPSNMELFTAYLGSYKDLNDPDQGKSFYTFGVIDQSVTQGRQIAYAPVDSSQGFWQFKSESAVINGKTVQLSGNTAIADTGTTLMIVSDQLCRAVYSQIHGAKYNQQQSLWLIPKANVAARPTVQVAIGTHMVTVEREHLASQDFDSTMAVGGLQSRGTLTFDIFGDIFLQNVYAVFDVGNQQFGVLQRNDPTPNGA